MKETTRQMIMLALSGDETVAADVKHWIGEILQGRLPVQTVRRGPLLTQKKAAAELGVSTVTFSRILKQLPADLPPELLPQQIIFGSSAVRIPPALVDYLRSHRGVKYTPKPRGRGGRKQVPTQMAA